MLADEGGALDCSGTRFLHADHQGSVVASADCSGNRVAVNAYDEYGVPAPANQGRIGYTGQAWLPGIGLWYYKARVYSPALGRFLQTDPVGYKDQVNLYAYVGDDPVNHTDPTGECTGSLFSNSAGECTTSSGIGPRASDMTAAMRPAAQFGAGPRGGTISENRGGQQRGDPGRTSKPDGSGNPDKKFKPGGKPGTRIFNDPTTGKPVTKPWPEDGRKGGDGTGVHPGSKYPDGTPVNPGGNKSKLVVGGLAVAGAVACAVAEPCGAAVVTALGIGGTAVLATQ